jgi:cytoskeleton protein RodZ
MHLWTHADRPLVGTRLFLAHYIASAGLGWRALLRRGARAAVAAPPRHGSRPDGKRSRRGRLRQSEIRHEVVAVSALEDEFDPAALPKAQFPSVGALLRQAREASGGELQRISTALRIRPEHLRAIEAANYADLPAPAYAMGFIRSYAEHLGLDAAELVRRFKQESAGDLRAPDLAFPQPLRPRRISLAGALVGFAILALCAFGAWHEISGTQRNRDEIVAAPPPALMAPPANAASPAPAAKTVQGPATTLASVSPAAGPPSLPPRAEAATAHGIEPAQALQGAPPATATRAGAGHAQIVLRATAETWLEVKDGESSIFRKLLQPGDEYPLPDKPGLALHIGNVHGIEVLADGKPLPSSAQPSQSRRTVVTLEARELIAKATIP